MRGAYLSAPHRSRNTRRGAEGQSRTGDTAIFSRVLYHLSYLGRDLKSIGGFFRAASVANLLLIVIPARDIVP